MEPKKTADKEPRVAPKIPKVMEKVFNILKRELSAEEYLIYLKAITPMIGNATSQLRDITKKMSLEDVVPGQNRWKKQKHNPRASVRSV